MENILAITDLSVALPGKSGTVPILHQVGLTIAPGEIVGLVGESGSGKSMTAFAVTRLLPGGAKSITGGSIKFNGQELTVLSEAEIAGFRGKEVAMIFQEPMTCLNPVFTIGRQISDVIITHQKVTRREAKEKALQLLGRVHIRDTARVFSCYPHALSGGMRQRVMIAIALSSSPRLLIADEPTTALDVTIQAQIIALMQEACRESGTGVLFISHDLGVVSQICDRIAVMYSGQIVESGRAEEVLNDPRHPYTKALLAAIPNFATDNGEGKLQTISGMVPEPTAILPGCRFAPRCPEAWPLCTQQVPAVTYLQNRREVRCHLTEGGKQ